MSTVKTNAVVLGQSATDTNNFLLDTDTAGALRIRRRSDGSGGLVMLINSAGIPSIPNLTITQANQTPLPGAASLISYTHGLGVVPTSAELELVCLVAELGYSVGDVVTPYTTGNGSYVAPFVIAKNSMTISARCGSVGSFTLTNNTTGVTGITATAANWAWRFKVRTA